MSSAQCSPFRLWRYWWTLHVRYPDIVTSPPLYRLWPMPWLVCFALKSSDFFEDIWLSSISTSHYHIFLFATSYTIDTSQWRHVERDSVSNHRRLDCLPNRLFRPHQRKHQSSTWLAFVKVIHRWPVNSPHKGPVTRKMFSFNDVII